ncbi:hypothetical protein INR49_027252 [Caranx melampygus]|nr:hypothetical protein INR49_027252 [Caranx melampygus]
MCLDLASFLISDSGGEKLSFKVTVLLAVTVLQLILNEILPSSSNRIPLIAVYCIGMFALMLLSLVETIVVMYLLEKDSASQGKKSTDRDRSSSDDCNKRATPTSSNVTESCTNGLSVHVSTTALERLRLNYCLWPKSSSSSSSSSSSRTAVGRWRSSTPGEGL